MKHPKTRGIENLLLGLLEDQQNWRPPTIELPMGAVKITQWFRMGDHPNVLQDYESGLMGDINIDQYFIPAYDSHNGNALPVICGSFIVQFSSGTFTVLPNPGKLFPT